MVILAFVVAYSLRITDSRGRTNSPMCIPCSDFVGFVSVQTIAIITTFFFYRQYYIPRAISRVDQIYYIWRVYQLAH